jgi:biopolymer transport protein ExbB
MFDLLLAGGWIMVPLLICSVVALAIIIERTWQLRLEKIMPKGLTVSILHDIKERNLNTAKLIDIQNTTPLGELLVIIIKNVKNDRSVILNQLEEAGRAIIHKLERHLSLLGTIATVSPFLGLLGTVFGMIDIFSVINTEGVGNSNILAGGIAQALVTTAAGLSIAIPSLVCYRALQRKLDEISHKLEYECMRFLDNLIIISKANAKVNTETTVEA